MASMARELGAQRIRVNGIAPGIKTGINRAAWDTPQGVASLLQLIPYGRVGDVGDVARPRSGSRRTSPTHHRRDALRRRRHNAVPGVPVQRLTALQPPARKSCSL